MKKIILLLCALCALSVHSQTLSDANADWLQIRNETTKGANTAVRIGDAGTAIIDGVRDTLASFAALSDLSDYYKKIDYGSSFNAVYIAGTVLTTSAPISDSENGYNLLFVTREDSPSIILGDTILYAVQSYVFGLDEAKQVAHGRLNSYYRIYSFGGFSWTDWEPINSQSDLSNYYTKPQTQALINDSADVMRAETAESYINKNYKDSLSFIAVGVNDGYPNSYSIETSGDTVRYSSLGNEDIALFITSGNVGDTVLFLDENSPENSALVLIEQNAIEDEQPQILRVIGRPETVYLKALNSFYSNQIYIHKNGTYINALSTGPTAFYVTTNTTQSISGAKTFAENVALSGNGTAFEDLNFTPLTGGGPASTRPDDVTINDVFYKEFTASNNQTCGDQKELPHAYKLGSSLYPHIHIFLKTGETIGTTGVTFRIYYEIRNSAGTTSSFSDVSATSAQLSGAPGVTIYDGTIAGASILGSQISMRIARTSGNAGDVIVTSYGVHYEVDGFGSNTQTTK